MERNEQKVRTWIKGTWVRIKKNERPPSTPRIPRLMVRPQ
jgi:hypothetical protein